MHNPYATKPYKFIGFGAMDATKPYKFIGSGAMEVTKPYKFIGFGSEPLKSGPSCPGLRSGPSVRANWGSILFRPHQACGPKPARPFLRWWGRAQHGRLLGKIPQPVNQHCLVLGFSQWSAHFGSLARPPEASGRVPETRGGPRTSLADLPAPARQADPGGRPF
jgi:hypothetical protein